MNSLIRVTCDRNKNIGLPLLSGRCVLRKALNLGSKQQNQQKWSMIQPRAKAVLDSCIQNHDKGIRDVLNKSDRWTPPRMQGVLMNDADVEASLCTTRSTLQSSSTAWALRNHRMFHPLGQPSVDVCVAVQTCTNLADATVEHAELHHGMLVYIPCDKNFSVHWFFTGHITDAHTLDIDRPLTYTSSAKLLEHVHNQSIASEDGHDETKHHHAFLVKWNIVWQQGQSCWHAAVQH
eukprot:15430290-Alexandrium_andersonii.AAC.1